jgi:CreA protein
MTEGGAMSKIEWGGESTAALAVSDYGRSLAWYRDVLGFEPVFELEDYGWAQLRSPVDGLLVGIGQSEEVEQGGGATLTFTVRNIAAARSYLEGEDVRFDGETHQVGEMVKLATFYDPDGNALMLAEPHTIVLLRRPPDAPDLPEAELDRIQDAHVANMRRLRADGKLLLAGPFDEQPDESWRGLCILLVDVEEGRALLADDPAIRAGRMVADVFTWLVPAGELGAGT